MSIQRCCPEATVFRADFAPEAVLFRAFADPVRLTILATLARSEFEVCVCDLTAGLAQSQSTVSHHLKLLKDAGLISGVRRGTWVYYSLCSNVSERLSEALGNVLPGKVFA